MSYRYMRLLVLFDLPMQSRTELKKYQKFRKFLLTEGFIMMQKSVYVKLCLNTSTLNLLKAKVRKEAPQEGLIQMIGITEKQYSSIEYITGYQNIETIDSDERIIFL